MNCTSASSFLIIASITLFAAVGRSQEELISFDSGGKVYVLTRDMEKDLRIFPEISNFYEARIFQTASGYVVEVLYGTPGRMFRQSLTLEADQLDQIRSKMAGSTHEFTQEGRVRFIVNSTILSLGYYGWAVPASLDINDPELIAATYMFTGAAGFLGPYMLTRKSEVTVASEHLHWYGATRGIVHGLVFAELVHGDNISYRGRLGWSLVGSAAEGYAGFLMGKSPEMSGGKAHAVGTGGDFGGFIGAATADLFTDNPGRGFSGMVLAGSAAGLFAGNLISTRESFTEGDAKVWYAAGALGAYIPVAVIDATNPKSDKPYLSAAIAGSVAGLTVGLKMINGKDFTSNQGTFIQLGELAGGLTGFGTAYLFSSKDRNGIEANRALFLLSGAAGAITGMWLTYRSFSDQATVGSTASRFRLQVTPQNFLLARHARRDSELIWPMANLNILLD